MPAPSAGWYNRRMKIRPQPALCVVLWAVVAVGCADAPPGTGCTTATDCLIGETCAQGACVRSHACEANGDCGDDEVCSGGICALLACDADSTCGALRICDEGRCERTPVDFCVADEDCGGAPCDLEARRCGIPIAGCGEGPPCEMNQECVDDRCVCAADDQCLGGRYCTEEGACERGCRAIGDECGLGMVCDAQSHTCRPSGGCDDDGDCDGRQYCDGAACVDGCSRLTVEKRRTRCDM